MTRLDDIRALLQGALGNEALVDLVSTRVALRTGVSLTETGPQEDVDEERVQQVVLALQDMGYSLQSLTLVAEARRKGDNP